MLAPLEAMAGIRRGDAIHATFVARGAANYLARNRSLALAPGMWLLELIKTVFSKLIDSLMLLIFFMYWSICDITSLLASCGSIFMLLIFSFFRCCCEAKYFVGFSTLN